MLRRSLVVSLVTVACRGELAPGAASSTEAALAEFHGAYPAEPRPNGNVYEFEITAEPTEMPLIDGAILRVWAYNGRVPGPVTKRITQAYIDYVGTDFVAQYLSRLA